MRVKPVEEEVEEAPRDALRELASKSVDDTLWLNLTLAMFGGLPSVAIGRQFGTDFGFQAAEKLFFGGGHA
jgi:methyl coenzyme M reductase beta subunit